jgi:hypothetical protein
LTVFRVGVTLNSALYFKATIHGKGVLVSEKDLKKEIKIIQAYGDKASSSRASAVESLKKAGIYDKKGHLKTQSN